MSIHLIRALNAVEGAACIDLPVMPWRASSAMVGAAREVCPLDEATVHAIYDAMLGANGN